MNMLTGLSVSLVLFIPIFIEAKDPPFGQLSVDESTGKLVGSNEKPVQLRGMSLFWSQWMSKFWDDTTIKAIKCKWNSNVVRAAMAADNGGFNTDGELSGQQYKLLTTVADAAIAEGIYVLLDYHDGEGDPDADTKFVTEFFDAVSKKYTGVPNILYEDFNEPFKGKGTDWSQLKTWHEGIIKTIRANDPKNIIIVGTPTWDQDVDKASADPIKDQKNIMYALHFYAATHKQDLRDRVQKALDAKLPVFVTEYGTTPASGDGAMDKDETQKWWDFLEKNQISYINWAIDDKSETAAALTAGSTDAQVGDSSHWSEDGKFVNAHMVALKDQGITGC